MVNTSGWISVKDQNAAKKAASANLALAKATKRALELGATESGIKIDTVKDGVSQEPTVQSKVTNGDTSKKAQLSYKVASEKRTKVTPRDATKEDRSCRRCASTGHILKQCTERCQNCGRVESWCTATQCTAKCSHCEGNHMSRQCRQCTKCAEYGHLKSDCKSLKSRCVRCGKDDHDLATCNVACTKCNRVKSKCSADRCLAKCELCGGRHLADVCPRYRMEIRSGKYTKVEITPVLLCPVISMSLEEFPRLS